jgi:hypothetical protein
MSETFLEERIINSKITTAIVSYALPRVRKPPSTDSSPALSVHGMSYALPRVRKPPSTYSSPALSIHGIGSIWAFSGDLISNSISWWKRPGSHSTLIFSWKSSLLGLGKSEKKEIISSLIELTLLSAHRRLGSLIKQLFNPTEWRTPRRLCFSAA